MVAKPQTGASIYDLCLAVYSEAAFSSSLILEFQLHFQSCRQLLQEHCELDFEYGSFALKHALQLVGHSVESRFSSEL